MTDQRALTHEASAVATPGQETGEETRLVQGLAVTDVVPAKMPGTEEQAWKLLVQFPWSRYSDLLYMPQKHHNGMPKIGPHDMIVQRGSRRVGTPGIEDAHFNWKLMVMDPSDSAAPVPPPVQSNSAAPVPPPANSEPETVPPPVEEEVTPSPQPELTLPKPAPAPKSPVRRSSNLMSEQEASARAQTALQASTRMVSGYLSTAGQRYQKEYTWRDMVDVATAVADAFVDWLDESTLRQLSCGTTVDEIPEHQEAVDLAKGIVDAHLASSERP